MKKTIISFFLILPLIAVSQSLPMKVVPQPKEAYFRSNADGFALESVAIVVESPNILSYQIDLLNDAIEKAGFQRLPVFENEVPINYSRKIYLGICSSTLSNMLDSIPEQNYKVSSDYPGKDGYILDIYKNIIINGSDLSGLINGIYTLISLLENHLGNVSLPSLRIIDAPDFPERWVYYPTNFLVAQNITNLKANWTKWRELKLSSPYVTDYKFDFITEQPKRYTDSITSVVKFSRDLDFEPVVGFFSFGYSNGMMYFNPNYAAGLPVRNQLFEIQDVKALLHHTVNVTMSNGDLESHNGNDFPGFAYIDAPGVKSFLDTEFKHSGNASVRFELDRGNTNYRVCYRTPVSPFKQYHVSGWCKTENATWTSQARITAINTKGYTLSYANSNIAKTKDWTRIDITFNSLESDTVYIYWGVWGGFSGKIWWDDLLVEECAFVNLLRRDGTPLSVNHQILGLNYQEKVDFDSLFDPKLGRVFSYNGEYDSYHTPPVLTATATGGLKEGTKIMASYYHTAVIYDGQIMASTTEPSLYKQIENQFIVIDSLFHAERYFMNHDEIRLFNWDYGDQQKGMTAGELLADNTQKCIDIIRKYSPDAKLADWSDMFDEYHNAKKSNYYLVNGDLTGSADLISKDILMLNWNTQQSAWQQSLDFFETKGFSQMSAPFYDTDQNNIRKRKEQTKNTKNFLGMMYTTWAANYNYVQHFAEYAWNHAPYIFHEPLPTNKIIADGVKLDLQIFGDWMDAGWQLSEAKCYYRLSPNDEFKSVDVDISKLPDCNTYIMLQDSVYSYFEYYITATDNHNWTTKVPFGENTSFIMDLRGNSVKMKEPKIDIRHEQNQIRIATYEPIEEIGIYDILGNNVVNVGAIHELPALVDISSLPIGIYFLKIKTGKQEYLRKISVIR
ncbi:MAG: hypothetical protein A2X64_05875 [Ignavibacteria bacterium GWF2_33_9]|nr:MAG: hypothetical protein A2X64_05875 [Ignavibacteria bacterium GWF2_33_9]